jgi:4-hydroxymandelate oxidase
VTRAVEAGARALVLTADTPLVGTKREGERSVWSSVEPGWLRSNFDGDADPAQTAEKATDLGPQDVAWLAARFGLPVVVKGVLHPEDARRCVEAGAAAVWVSNHGGRQLDRALPTAHALGDVVAEVGDAVEVYVDGGVRSAPDVLTALALGARAVFLGRPVMWALADDGADGVHSLLAELTTDLEECLRLAGEPSAARVPRDLVVQTRL